jgi:hypothetical protein
MRQVHVDIGERNCVRVVSRQLKSAIIWSGIIKTTPLINAIMTDDSFAPNVDIIRNFALELFPDKLKELPCAIATTAVVGGRASIEKVRLLDEMMSMVCK